jgi:hypothetical protein
MNHKTLESPTLIVIADSENEVNRRGGSVFMATRPISIRLPRLPARKLGLSPIGKGQEETNGSLVLGVGSVCLRELTSADAVWAGAWTKDELRGCIKKAVP